jgi:glucose/arabinose dehydrogenase
MTPIARIACHAVLLAAAALTPAASAATVRVDTVADDLAWPWNVAFLPDGGFLVTERAGALLRLAPDGTVAARIEGVPEVLFAGQGGLFDVLLAPDFAASGRLWLTYAAGTPTANATHVWRARLEGDALVDGEPIFAAEPEKTTPQHYGGRIAALPDGTLLVTTGDGWDHKEDAQRLGSLLGKTVRITGDGDIPADNPFVGDADARDAIYTLGHRNPQGLAVAPDGTIWSHEHGPAGGDEINRLRPGANYGWPVATRGEDYIGARISPFESYPGMVDPLLHWTPSIAPSGLTVYDGAAFPEWRGDLLLGGLAIVGLYHVPVDGGAVGEDARVVPAIDERVRDVRTGPDGLVYVLTDADPGRLLRLRPGEP